MTPQQFVTENELSWWLQKLTLAEVRKLFIAQTGEKISTKGMKEYLDYHCVIYRVWKRKPRSKSKLLTPDQWDNLRHAVDHMKPIITGIGLSNATQVVQTICSTNQHQLSNLPSRFHYWLTFRKN